MARKPPLSDDELYSIAIYLACKKVETEIHAELPRRHQRDFEQEYTTATDGYTIPTQSTTAAGPYYIWPDNANKQGRELRIYFMPMEPEPPIVSTLTDHGRRWHARNRQCRINHSNLVMQLFECGFVLGGNQDRDRINQFLRQRFPVSQERE